MKIITNNVPRDVIDDAYELTPAERERFDYLDWPAIDAGEDSASFFRYRGELYDLGDTMATERDGELARAGWGGYVSESFFSAIVVRLVDNGERVVIGLALS